MTLTPPGKSAMTLRPTIVKLEPGREFRWLGSLGMRGLFDGEHGFRVVPEDVGRCRFEHFETFTGLLVAPVMWMVGEATRAGLRGHEPRAEGACRKHVIPEPSGTMRVLRPRQDPLVPAAALLADVRRADRWRGSLSARRGGGWRAGCCWGAVGGAC